MKQWSLKLVIPDGIVIDVKDEHPEKQWSLKLVIPDGIVIDVNLKQL